MSGCPLPVIWDPHNFPGEAASLTKKYRTGENNAAQPQPQTGLSGIMPHLLAWQLAWRPPLHPHPIGLGLQSPSAAM